MKIFGFLVSIGTILTLLIGYFFNNVKASVVLIFLFLLFLLFSITADYKRQVDSLNDMLNNRLNNPNEMEKIFIKRIDGLGKRVDELIEEAKKKDEKIRELSQKSTKKD